ncbi:OTU domain-containing protein [Nannocystis bainbridge]|uniref:OTU domain-containing protein n=1 Tax=Nannocystis bainbridge TaxID=2995303 RepID=A0ABT5DTY2_9BACT|nr:OTU domain-containing protein [Nannocystis bainbridge]MDC0715861.1 hypothetical protein [Nannocystis bainbridge]
MCIEAKACLHRIEWLRARGELGELGAYLLAIDSWKDQDAGTPEYAVYAGAMKAFRAMVWPSITLIDALIQEGQWESVECQRAHKLLAACHPMFVAYDPEVYARVARGEDANPGDDDDDAGAREWIEWLVDDEDEPPPDTGGYESDDSDDEFEEDLLEVFDDPRALTIEQFGFPESDRPSERSKKKKWLSRRAKQRGVLDARNKKAETVRALRDQRKITFRYQGPEIEPDPDLLIARVHGVRDGARAKEHEQIAMAGIHHRPDEWTRQAEADFQVAKAAFKAGDREALRGLATKFCLAQYRGITFKTSTFDARARQISRHENEVGRAIYSMSVLHQAGVSPTEYFRGNCSAKELEALERIALELKQVLLDKRNTGEVRVGGVRFDSHADAIQHIYTNQYDYFHSSVARYLANREAWQEDQASGLAKVREEARRSPEAARRTVMPATQEVFVAHVRALTGLGPDFIGYGAYLKAHGFVADEPTFKKADRQKTPLSAEFGLYQYDNYARGKPKFEYAEYLKLHADYSGYSADYAGWMQYLARTGERNEEVLLQLEDEFIQAHLKAKYGFVPPDDWVLFDGLLNGYCPLVSTGDNPRHALKYAYGMKFYSGHYHERLKPGWSALGRAKRPYVGKVYASLHTLEDYLEDAPNHVPSMNLHARIIVGDSIADEREATFPAYIPGGRTVIEHVAKIPSFAGATPEEGFSDAHLYKYGIDREEFAELHAMLRKAQAADAKQAEAEKAKKDKGKKDAPKKGKKGEPDPGKKSEPAPDEEVERDEDGGLETEVDWFLQRLCAWLVNYQEVRIVEIARRIALSRGRLLVYRNSLGELDRTLSSTVVNGVRLPGERGLEGQDPMVLRKDRRYTHTRDPDNKQAIIDKERSTWDRPRQQLRDRLAGPYFVHATPGDGNCLFHALAGILRLTLGRGLDHRAVRDQVVHAMGQPTHAALRGQYAIDAPYLAEMAQTCAHPGQIGRWGGDPEIHAFCWYYRLRVRVYAPTHPGPDHYTEFDPPPGAALQGVGYLLHVHGNHWEYLQPR